MSHQLKELGYVYDVYSGFQFDLNTTMIKTNRGYAEGHFCDHNCCLDCGNYACPAAFSKNKGVDAKSLISLEEVVACLTKAKLGMALMNQQFLDEYFDEYCQDFKIPKKIASEIKQTLETGQAELNMFGGNPELHPDFLEIIKQAHQLGWKVSTTTTGKKFMHDDKFIEGFLAHPPDSLAISADDYESMEELNQILAMDAPTIKKYWQKANPLYGQRKKAYESMYVAKLAKKNKRFPKILFNIVVHPGNLASIDQMLMAFSTEYPDAIVNPYPAQSSFNYAGALWQIEHLLGLEKFIDTMIQTQVKQAGQDKKKYVPRLPYWLALKSIFKSVTDQQQVLKHLSGYQTWRCYRMPGAGRYLQASSASRNLEKTDRVGGHLGCFWNRNTVTLVDQHLWQMSTEAVADYLLHQKPVLPAQSDKPCPGCIMPRLMFDGPAVELGLAPELVDAYLKLRLKYLKF
ncbi:radical SAM protein [Patescibacteria group bacterium]|nr:radical SAM protein [Patescibacteria group bacterium]